MSATSPSLTVGRQDARRPRIGFIGAGWIGQNRMKALAEEHLCDMVAMVEPNRAMANAAQEIAPNCVLKDSIDALLDMDLDGVAIATPSALHASQAIAAFNRGLSVFCQKPLARNLQESRQVVDAARSADRLLCVDFSYRFLRGVGQIRELIQTGVLGEIYIVDLVFHNAYGPDKSWFYDPRLSGGGCVIDLGIHLVDLVLWIFDYPAVREVNGRLFKNGKGLHSSSRNAEDYASVSLLLENDVLAHLCCSWKAHAGCDAVIEFSVYGTSGGVRLRNVNGSFFDFQTERFHRTRSEILSVPPEKWGGRAAADWLRKLSISHRFDHRAGHFLNVAATLDRIYAL